MPSQRGRPRVLLGASHSAIENLGLIYLLGVARDEGCDRGVSLVRNHDFEPFFERVNEFKPDIVGFNIYTGAHTQLFEAFDRLKKEHPGVRLVIGGPHATYFPEEAIRHADNVVMSEGFNAFRRILQGNVGPGILEFGEENKEAFPHPDRGAFYQDSPEHALSPIKSIIGMTGCPYSCSYCYNSTSKDAINVPTHLKIKEGGVPLPQFGEKKKSTRLFPLNIREVEAVIREAREVAERWPETKIFYFQDDVFGFNINKEKTDGTRQLGSLEELAERWPSEVGIPFHAQMRWEMTDHDSGARRLDLARKAGASGLTLAIEAADPVIRKEVLDRNMSEDVMFQGMARLMERGFTVRTEQITGLPYGATSTPTKMNLAADLQLLELNVRLREKTGGPTMAWASTLAPYKKTNIGTYCKEHGHYDGINNDVPDTFFDKSVLRFPAEWMGPSLKERKEDPSVWLSEHELEKYRTQNAELRRHFNMFGLMPQGDRAAATYLADPSKFGYNHLGAVIEAHVTELAARGNTRAQEIVSRIGLLRTFNFGLNGSLSDNKARQELQNLAPYLAVLPHPEETAERAVGYASSSNTLESSEAFITPRIVSTAVRHILYEKSLYMSGAQKTRNSDRERYPVKV